MTYSDNFETYDVFLNLIKDVFARLVVVKRGFTCFITLQVVAGVTTAESSSDPPGESLKSGGDSGDPPVELRKGKRCRVLFSYRPTHEDELELNPNELIDFICEVSNAVTSYTIPNQQGGGHGLPIFWVIENKFVFNQHASGPMWYVILIYCLRFHRLKTAGGVASLQTVLSASSHPIL